MHAYEVWGIALLVHVIGDFAFAIWDRRSHRLYLGCDPTGQRPLHYRFTASRVEFASMPVGLIATMPARPAVDAPKIAAFIDNRHSPLSSSYFEGIFRVPAGHYVVFDSGVRTERQYWDPQPKTLRLVRTEDYVDAFHAHIEQAVKARLRDAGQIVGTQLSSGRDSSTITAITARLLERTGRRVLSATGAPRAGFTGAAPERKAIDESAVAAETARLYANVAHIVVRPEHSFDFDDCARLWDYYQEPIINACNFPWLAGINRRLGEHGVSVLLTGDLGNLTISAGGYATLPDFLWQGSWRSWLREFRTLGAKGRMRWRGALAVSAGGYIPSPLWALLARATGRSNQDLGRPLIRKAWQSSDRTASIMAQPPRNTHRNRVDLILNTSIAGIRKGNLAQFGIDERDPTSDRRLIEFCLSLPADQLLKDGIERPLFTAAMTGLVAPDVIAGKLRGLQAADWY
ncbi:asparagine synthase-related protein, partial [Sphingomonas sp.]|uniref:asparagine synthase-related protein n=1 Tax=Sphingomonas sp. TaxID=28214 RepID=UPI00334092F3